MSVTSTTRSMYCVSLVDNFCHKTWIYFLKTKDEVFSIFQEFKALVENWTRKKKIILRSNNVGKYAFKDFNSSCKEAKTDTDLTILCNPQQNGEVEQNI